MKNKGMFIVLIIMFLIAVSGGVVGYLESKKEKPVEPEKPKGTITYKYFLEDQEVQEMPINEKTTDENGVETINELYTFSRFTCTNDVTGDFDTKEWKFLPKNEEESTCELYFVKAKYEVTLTITGSNATLDENNPKYVAREQDGQFIIKPTEGYVFDKTTCSDNKQTSWNETKNTLTISSVTKDVSCTVSFKLKELTVNINVTNGEGSTTKTVNYGESIKEVVTPKTGFGTPTIKCSSKLQQGVFNENTFNIDKVIDNNTCTITFNKTAPKKYSFKIELPAEITILNGSTSAEIEEGKDNEITFKVQEGYKMSLNCGDINPSKEESIDTTTKKYTFLGIKSNISCKATATKSE